MYDNLFILLLSFKDNTSIYTNIYLFCFLLADSYLLQIQEYVSTQVTSNSNKPDETKPTNSTQNEGNTPLPQPIEIIPKWFDVDIVKGTQFTVTAYQMPTEAIQSNVSFSCLYVLYIYNITFIKYVITIINYMYISPLLTTCAYHHY